MKSINFFYQWYPVDALRSSTRLQASPAAWGVYRDFLDFCMAYSDTGYAQEGDKPISLKLLSYHLATPNHPPNRVLLCLQELVGLGSIKQEEESGRYYNERIRLEAERIAGLGRVRSETGRLGGIAKAANVANAKQLPGKRLAKTQQNLADRDRDRDAETDKAIQDHCLCNGTDSHEGRDKHVGLPSKPPQAGPSNGAISRLVEMGYLPGADASERPKPRKAETRAQRIETARKSPAVRRIFALWEKVWEVRSPIFSDERAEAILKGLRCTDYLSCAKAIIGYECEPSSERFDRHDKLAWYEPAKLLHDAAKIEAGCEAFDQHATDSDRAKMPLDLVPWLAVGTPQPWESLSARRVLERLCGLDDGQIAEARKQPAFRERIRDRAYAILRAHFEGDAGRLAELGRAWVAGKPPPPMMSEQMTADSGEPRAMRRLVAAIGLPDSPPIATQGVDHVQA